MYFYCSIVIVTVLCVAHPTQQQREDINFNFGWRFSLGYTIQCPANAYSRKLEDIECDGLLPTRNTKQECRDACCEDILCSAWQYSDKQGCRIGQIANCTKKPGEGWTGEERDTPAAMPPASDGPGSKEFNDTSWEIVDLPHDGIINGTFAETNLKSHGYLPLNTTWYRKHFNLPADWKGKAIWLYFEGVYRASVTYVNGEPIHYQDSGYTSFMVRLDNVSSLAYGEGGENENIIAVKASSGGATAYSGHWYEGGGIYRPAHLVSADPVHFVPDGVYGASQVVGPIGDHDPNDPSKGQFADAEFIPVAEVVNTKETQVEAMVKFDIYDENGQTVATVTSQKVNIDAGETVLINTTIPKTSKIELWNMARPYLYQMHTYLITTSSQSMIDNVTHSIGVRQTRWDPNTGFYLNGKHFTWRGFNNHNDFTGVGVAVPDRVNLFRGQMMRAAGGNSWRMSHNPPVSGLLEVLDRIGIVVWDENRLMGNNIHWMNNHRDMVRRDRNHPSIMVWSFCNEQECVYGFSSTVAEKFKEITTKADPFRPVSANQNFNFGNGLSQVIDIQGVSHRDGDMFDTIHSRMPTKPVIGSECCSCLTQRGEDVADSSKKIIGSFNADCNQQESGYQLDRKFVAGCMIWTLFDYFGEPSPYGWPLVVGSFGSFDAAGFPKPSAYWYRTWWYYSAKSNASDSGYDVPVNPPPLPDPYASASQENFQDGYIIHIVQSWEQLANVTNYTIQAYTNAPMAELTVNGKSQGKVNVNWQGWAQWSDIPYSPGKITATALDSQNQIKATHIVETAGDPAKVVLTIDAPNEKTGTGSALVLDGQDAGMVAAAVVDAQGRVVPSYSDIVTFHIVRGPGRIIGVGNGDPSCHEPNKASWRSAYHGLARAIIQVTQNAASSLHHRKRLIQIDRDGGVRTYIVPPGDTSPRDEAIVVEASAKGLDSSTVSIPISADTNTHGVLAAAKKSLKRLRD